MIYNVMGLVCSARTLATLVDQTRPETSGEEVSPKGFDQDSNIQFTL